MTDEPPPQNPLAETSARLRLIAEAPESEAARGEVEAALRSKWWSLRVLAIRAIGAWGGAANKAWLVERAVRPGLSTRRGVPTEERWRDLETRTAATALAGLLGEADDEWLLDLWFADEGHAPALGGHLLQKTTAAVIDRRIARELARPRDERPKAALVWLIRLRRDLSDRRAILQRLSVGRDHAASHAAEILRWEARVASREAAAEASRKPSPYKARMATDALADAAARRLAGRKGRR